MKRIIALAALVAVGVVFADDAPVRAIMYEFTYVEATGVITHAQVIGGYPSVDACESQMGKVTGIGSVSLDEGEQMQLECSGIKEKLDANVPKVAPKVTPKVPEPEDTDEPAPPKTPI